MLRKILHSLILIMSLLTLSIFIILSKDMVESNLYGSPTSIKYSVNTEFTAIFFVGIIIVCTLPVICLSYINLFNNHSKTKQHGNKTGPPRRT